MTCGRLTLTTCGGPSLMDAYQLVCALHDDLGPVASLQSGRRTPHQAQRPGCHPSLCTHVPACAWLRSRQCLSCMHQVLIHQDQCCSCWGTLPAQVPAPRLTHGLTGTLLGCCSTAPADATLCRPGQPPVGLQCRPPLLRSTSRSKWPSPHSTDMTDGGLCKHKPLSAQAAPWAGRQRR
jgi:hypothetical protein